MNILLSAFACRPNYGSEPGVGWNFAVELAKEHQVYVFTRDGNREAIEQYEHYDEISQRITFLYYDLPSWMGFKDTESATAHIYYFLWQIGLYFRVKQWLKTHPIDLIHHITYGVFRIPSFLGMLDKPFLFGPLGGGESYPLRLAQSLPKKHLLIDIVRNAINSFSMLNPLLLLSFNRSTLIVCKTQETLDKIPSKYHHKCIVSMEIGLHTLPAIEKIEKKPGTALKLLFVGRLVYWKGPHLVIKAFAQLIKQYPDCELSIIGSGGDKAWLTDMAKQTGIYDKINWIERVSQQELFDMYSSYDFMVFPSLRDSSGNVVMEALAHQLPVLCLDLGGPCQIVSQDSGIVINTKSKSEAQIIKDIAQNLSRLCEDDQLLEEKKSSTQKQAAYHMIHKVVKRIYSNPLLPK